MSQSRDHWVTYLFLLWVLFGVLSEALVDAVKVSALCVGSLSLVSLDFIRSAFLKV